MITDVLDMGKLDYKEITQPTLASSRTLWLQLLMLKRREYTNMPKAYDKGSPAVLFGNVWIPCFL